MADEWKECHWGDLATIEYGKGLREYHKSIGQYRVFGTNGPIGWYTKPLCHHQTVIIGRKGAYRGVHYSPDPCFVIDTAFYLSPKIKFDMQWAYYELLTHDINAMDSGSAIPSTSRNDFYALPVRLPPLSEQRAIAHILGTLDDKIDLYKKMNETLEAIAQKLFKSWFVDFEPVKAKENGKLTVFPKQINELFPDSLEDSVCGMKPKGWEIKELGKLIEIIKGKSYKSNELQDSKNALVTLKSFLRGGGYRQDGLKSFIGDYKPEQVVKPGELIISFTDVTQAAEVIGKPAIVSANPQFETLIASLDVGIVRPKDERIITPYVYFLFGTDNYQSHIYAYCTGTTVLHLQKIGIQKYHFICPPVLVMKEFFKIVDPIFSLIESNIQQSYILTYIRDKLLLKLVLGEIRIQDVKKFLNERGL